MVKIDKKSITQGRCFIVAELSANHSKDLTIALKTIEGIAKAGADAVKLQTVDPNKITINCDNKYFRMPADTPWAGKSLYELEVETFLPKEWHKPLFDKAKDLGLSCFSSPFDIDCIDFLEDLNCPAYKIASFEITDIGLIKRVAQTNKPIIISTGIASIEDIDLAVKTCLENNNKEIILLKCTSAYPTPLSQVQLNSMKLLGEKFNCLYGLSDHTIGDLVPIASVALGSCMLEKHIKLDDSIKSADDFFSMNIKDLKNLVTNIRNVESCLGRKEWSVNESMKSGRKIARSLFITEDIIKGEEFDNKNLRSIRPGDGLHPKYLSSFIGKKSKRNINKGTPLDWDMID